MYRNIKSFFLLSLRVGYIVFGYSVPVFIIAVFCYLSLECPCQVFRPVCTTTVQCAHLIFECVCTQSI